MAPPKRKRKATRITANKRPKYTQPDSESSSSSEEVEVEEDSQTEWEALRILKQRGQGHSFEYLIEWAGIDPATGRQWEPTWEKADNASLSLRESWKSERELQSLEKKGTAAATAKTLRIPSASEAAQAQAAQNRATRRRRIVDSPESSVSDATVESTTGINRGTTTATQTSAIDIEVTTPDWTSPNINIDLRGDSLNRSEYVLHTEIPESQSSLTRSNDEDTDLVSSELFASQPAFLSSGIVSNTQSSVGDVSYIPITQEELDSSSLSDSSDESTEANIIGYSGYLDVDVAPKLGARAQSPATLIAETVADTTQDLQSERQLYSQQEQSETTGTFELSEICTLTDHPTTESSPIHSRLTNTTPARSESLEGQDESVSAIEVAFIDNSTQADSGVTSRNSQLFPQEQSRFSAPTEVIQKSVETDSQNDVSFPASEGPVIADTPQISQFASTILETAPQSIGTDSRDPFEIEQQSAEVESSVSLTERTFLEENAQFPFQSQRPTVFEPKSAYQRAFTDPPRICSTHEITDTQLVETSRSSAAQEDGVLHESEESTTIDEISQPPVSQDSIPPSQEQSQTKVLTAISPENLRRPSASRRSSVSPTDFTGRILVTKDIVDREAVSQQPPLSEGSSKSYEHNAQIVPPETSLSTQNHTPDNIRTTIEVDNQDLSHDPTSSPCSRHDSSQETPERQFQRVEPSFSPIPHPPSYSLRAVDSNIPSRPVTPTLSSSLFKMAESTSTKVERRLREVQEAARAANPFVPRRERTRAFQASSVASTSTLAAAVPPQPAAVPTLPAINIPTEGTRSPSTVPDRSPAPPAQTSLRGLAFANAKDKATESLLGNPLAATTSIMDAGPTQEKAVLLATTAPTAAPLESSAPPEQVLADDGTDDMSEADADDVNEDDDQVIEDEDLRLEPLEYIVPLSIEGRQCDTYNAYLKRKQDLFEACQMVESIDETDSELHSSLEEALRYLKAVETHPDLIYAEAESVTDFENRSANDVQHGAQFGIDNSIKFKFLQELFERLREEDFHIVLLLDEDIDALFNILRTFLTSAQYNYSMPTKGYQSDTSSDTLTITVFPNTASPILRPTDLVICLDGVQRAGQIRQSNWAMASGKTVPVLHLVIPQTVGHIERCILDGDTRIELILAALAQIVTRHEVGKAVNPDTPSALEAASMLATWLIYSRDEDGTKWPLPSIEGMNGFMEYESTQQPAASAASSPVPERTKRSLEVDESDASKRMRYTPLANTAISSGNNHEHEITRISDSMPGTAMSGSAQLEETRSELRRIRKEFQEKEAMWDRQQTEHENRAQEYRKIFNEKAEVSRAHESMSKTRDKLKTQLEAQTAELKSLREELEAQRALGLKSQDEKDVEITQLRKELELAQLDRDRALKSVQSTESTLEYTKEQYRTASNTAGQLQTDLTSLQSQNAKLTHQASGEVAKLKQMHFDKSTKNMVQQNKALTTENIHLKAMLKQKEEELIRAKSSAGRTGYGTRAQSTTPQPKTRSRATTPVRGGRRIANLMAEER